MGFAFVYVFNDYSRDKLLELGYQLLKSNEDEHVYIFENDGIAFDDADLVFAFSNTLTF